MNDNVIPFDIEAAFNARNWLQRACEAQGAKTIGGWLGRGGSAIDIELEGCNFSLTIKPAGLPCDDTLTDALVRVIDGWRETHPNLTYFETVTVIEGIGRMLHNLRAAATQS